MINNSIHRRLRCAGFDSEWMASLAQAIKTNNEPALWEVLNRHPDQVEAYSYVAEEIGRMAYRALERVHFAEIFAMPIIEQTGGGILANDAAYNAAAFCIAEVLDGWMPPKTSKTVFAGLRTYDWVSSWRFAIQRSHLLRTVPGSPLTSATFLTEDVVLPPEAPRLAFLLMVLSSTRGWVRLPEANSLRDNRLKSVVSCALQQTEAGRAPLVLAPDKLRYAMADGLCLWLSMLNDAVPITGWLAAPSPASQDVVKITLGLQHEQLRYTQLTLRKHQLSLAGLDGVIAMLASIAPRLDHPMDLPARSKTERRLLLT